MCGNAFTYWSVGLLGLISPAFNLKDEFYKNMFFNCLHTMIVSKLDILVVKVLINFEKSSLQFLIHNFENSRSRQREHNVPIFDIDLEADFLKDNGRSMTRTERMDHQLKQINQNFFSVSNRVLDRFHVR